MTAGQLLGGLANRAVISVIGCGGKTTFIQSLAKEMHHKKVLISPTTKIYPMPELGQCYQDTLEGVRSHIPQTGIQCLGLGNPALGKLTALPSDLLESMVVNYDLALLEADGSQGLPCKGWLETEPVIVPYTTHTVGIITLLGLHQKVSTETVLRIPQFNALTGLHQGDWITEEALAKMVLGMFQKAVGKTYLLVNQAPEIEAKGWLTELKQQYPNAFSSFAYGNALKNTWNEVL